MNQYFEFIVRQRAAELRRRYLRLVAIDSAEEFDDEISVIDWQFAATLQSSGQVTYA
jgi:hypothetical protein